MKERFIDWNPRPATLAMVETINSILAEYQAQGFRLTLRQLYYQLVARGIIENNIRSYKNTGEIVSNARHAGMIDWAMIEDRGRELTELATWRDPAEIVDAAARGFRIDKWEDQSAHVIVMVEKQALEGVLIPVCQELQIAFMANKGYASASAFYETAKRLIRQAKAGKDIYVLYLGDHDPSGIDMTRDTFERLTMFMHGRGIEVNRLALNMDQIEEMNPPENPAKTTDSRAASYIAEFGESSWELDAVEPATLAELVRNAVYGVRDIDLWEEAVNREDDMRRELEAFARSYRNKS